MTASFDDSLAGDRRVTTASGRSFPGMERIPGGSYMMGSNNHYPEEAPAHRVTVDSFLIDRWAVTNADFARFVAATGYVTFAERAPRAEDYPGATQELLVPGSVVFQRPKHRVDTRNIYDWWAYIAGANWRHPAGPQSSIEGLEDHPLVHVAFEDAGAYATWAGKSLPTEAEWEFAARGGIDGGEYAWGSEFTPGGRSMANTWHGEFPHENLSPGEYSGTVPVGSYPPNGYGLFDMTGNCWEWTSDWYQDHARAGGNCCSVSNPRGGIRESSINPSDPVLIPRKVMKGGSYLCAPNYCQRYRPAARMAQPIDTATCHLGFRCVVRLNG